ncbi:MAG: HD family phosphohydrolase [Dehalococcoidia bacterium]
MARQLTKPNVSRMSAGLFGLIIAAATVVLVVPLFRLEGDLKEGDIAPATLSAPHEASFESAALTDAAKTAAAEQVPQESLPVDTSVRDAQLDKASRYLDQVRDIATRIDITTQQKQDLIAKLATPSTLTNAERAALQSLDVVSFEVLDRQVVAGLTALMSTPLKADQIEPAIGEYVSSLPSGQLTAAQSEALTGVLRVFAVETFRLDATATEKKKEQARQAVAPVFRTFAAGQVIVTEGQVITDQDIEALKATGVIEDGLDLYAIAAGVMVALGAGLLVAVYTFLLQPFAAPANRRMVLVAVSFGLILVTARVVLPLVTPDSDRYYAFGVPVAAAAIITASFADLSLAALLAVMAGLLAAYIGGTAPQIAGTSYVGSLQSLELAMTYVAGGLVGAAVVHRASRLSRFAMASIAVAIATGTVMVVFWMVSAQRANVDLAWIGLAAGIHGLVAAGAALGVFVVLALFFGVTTRLQLMELAQAEHPLLRRLQDEAPGTYHHSMLVGALAERAASGIGADALLVRVGAYYHDIGKLAMPDHYVENMLGGNPSPHDAMEPVDSARVIRAHVTNGIELAKKYRLPLVVRNFIPQHHGTRLVTYFYRQATAEGQTVSPADFRYEGPRPQTREAAIIMLADSSEAVARARQDDSTASIDQIVDSVFAERLAEGQLDECDITLRELQAVAASFKTTLRAVYHPRVQYPSATPDEIAQLARGETPVHN